VTNNNPARVTLDNTTMRFGAAAQFIGAAYPFDWIWINTPAAIAGAVIPNVLFTVVAGSLEQPQYTCRGVDLSAVSTILAAANGATASPVKVLLDSCQIAPGVTRLAASSISPAGDQVELINCFDGTGVLNERYTPAGAVTTDRSVALSAQDDIGLYSLKLVSSARSDFCALPLEAFWIDVGNTDVGAAKTATVEIVSSASLNNTDIRLALEYQGSAGSPLTKFGDSLGSVLATVAALPASSAPWVNPPATPVKQQLRVSFTPQAVGRVRGLVRLGKPSTTVWVNPVIAIT
jgi:hypothetical protein